MRYAFNRDYCKKLRRQLMMKQSSIYSIVAVFTGVAASLCLSCPALAANLVKDGKAVAVVAVTPDSNDDEKAAVQDLTTYVEKMSGVKLESATVDAKDT